MRRLLPDPAAELSPEDVVAAYRPPPGRALRVNFIAALDGATTVAGKSRGLQMPGDLLVFRVLRALGDAILVGAGTAAAEGYGPMEDDPVVVRLREDLGRPATAPIVVVSRRASVPLDTRLIGGRVPSMCVTCEAADPPRRGGRGARGPAGGGGLGAGRPGGAGLRRGQRRPAAGAGPPRRARDRAAHLRGRSAAAALRAGRRGGRRAGPLHLAVPRRRPRGAAAAGRPAAGAGAAERGLAARGG